MRKTKDGNPPPIRLLMLRITPQPRWCVMPQNSDLHPPHVPESAPPSRRPKASSGRCSSARLERRQPPYRRMFPQVTVWVGHSDCHREFPEPESPAYRRSAASALSFPGRHSVGRSRRRCHSVCRLDSDLENLRWRSYSGVWLARTRLMSLPVQSLMLRSYPS